MIEVEAVKKWARAEFVVAAKAFEKAPSAGNWAALRISMLVWQQAAQLKSPSAAGKLPELLQTLDGLDQEFWGEAIVRFKTGESVNQIDVHA